MNLAYTMFAFMTHLLFASSRTWSFPKYHDPQTYTTCSILSCMDYRLKS